MHDNGPRSFKIAIDTTAPTDTNTVVIFSSVTAYGARVMPHLPVARHSFAVENSHSGTLKAYRSTDGGTTWDQVGGDIAVAVPSATDISGPYDFLTDTYIDWKLEFTTTATQTTWRPEMHGHEDRQPGT